MGFKNNAEEHQKKTERRIQGRVKIGKGGVEEEFSIKPFGKLLLTLINFMSFT